MHLHARVGTLVRDVPVEGQQHSEGSTKLENLSDISRSKLMASAPCVHIIVDLSTTNVHLKASGFFRAGSNASVHSSRCWAQRRAAPHLRAAAISRTSNDSAIDFLRSRKRDMAPCAGQLLS